MDGNDKSRLREDPNGLLVRTAPLDGAAQVYVPTHMRYGVMMREHYPPQAGHPVANKMYTSMRRWFYWESMVVDVYAFVAKCTQCARNRVGKRRKTNYLKTFPPTEPLTDLCMDLLRPLPRTVAGNEHLLVIVDRFSKMTRAIPLQRIDAETITEALLDYLVAAYGPPATVLSDNGPQFRSTFFQGVCSLLGISNRYSTTYHPQTNGQVERYNRTIVGQLRTYVEDHQDRWDVLVSMLTLAYNSRPQQSTGVALLEFVSPERVRGLSVERMVGYPTSEETDGSPRAIRLWTRWWGYHPEEDTHESSSRFDLRKVHQYMRRVGLRVEEAGSVVDVLAQDNSHAGHVVFKVRIVADFRLRHVFRSGPRGRGGDHLCRMPGRRPSPRPGGRLRRSDRMDGFGGVRWNVMADRRGSVGRWTTRGDRVSA